MLVLYLCVLIVFSLHWESLKLILVDEPLPKAVLSQWPLWRVGVMLEVWEGTFSIHEYATLDREALAF
jgi:hypothetical protein